MGDESPLITICFHCGQDKYFERKWPAVPRVGDRVLTEELEPFIVVEVHWEDDLIGDPYVHVHLEPVPK